MAERLSITLLHVFCVGLLHCQDMKGVATGYDFQTYKVFKVESTMAGDNSKCNCTVDAEESGYSWNQWSVCQGHQQSFQCHRGIQYRRRTCSFRDALRSCKQREWRYCYNEESCTGEWQGWTNAVDGGVCSHSCGGGVIVKVRACVKNNEVGLFCAGKNRSPYDIKKESCNTQKCPAWSDWMVMSSNCSSNRLAEEKRTVTYLRRCEYKEQRSEGCEGSEDGESQQTITRYCDETPLSFAQSRASNDGSKGFSVNTMSYVLFGVIGLLVVLLIASVCIIKWRKTRAKDRVQTETQDGGVEKSHSFVASHSVARAPPEIPVQEPKSKWKTPENYEEITVEAEPIHGSFAARVAAKTAATMALPLVPPPLRRSFQDLRRAADIQSTTYTCMNGSPNDISPTRSSRPFNGQKVLPDSNDPRNATSPPIPKRNFFEEYPPPPPPDLAFDGSFSSGITPRNNSVGSPRYVGAPKRDDHLYLESSSLQRPEKEIDSKERHVKRRKSEEYKIGKGRRKRQKSVEDKVTGENSISFSKLHSNINFGDPDDNLTSQGHLYAEIHDNTRF